MDRKLMLIINPCAGQKKANKYLTEILQIFSQYDYENIVYVTSKKGNATDIVKRNFKDKDLIVCVGGDGTFNEVVSGMIEVNCKIPVGYIPAGSTNDFANSIGLSKKILKAEEDIMKGDVKLIDIGKFNNQYFSYVASFGAFTKASYSTSQGVKNALGYVAYILEGIKDIPSIHSEHLKIRTHSKVIEGDYIFGAISNSKSIGGFLTIKDEFVDINDGKFEVLLVKNPDNLGDISKIIAAITEQKYNSEMFEFFSAKSIEIETSEKIPWSLDGEYKEGNSVINIKNIHNAVKLITNTEK